MGSGGSPATCTAISSVAVTARNKAAPDGGNINSCFSKPLAEPFLGCLSTLCQIIAAFAVHGLRCRHCVRHVRVLLRPCLFAAADPGRCCSTALTHSPLTPLAV